MAAIVYNTIPSWDTFEKDSSIVFGIRSHDTLLRQIDATLISFQGMRHLTASQAALEQLLSLGRLYFAVDLWLKEFARKVGDAGRKPAIDALFNVVCREIAGRARISISALADWIKATYGRGINCHAVSLDYDKGLARYLTLPEMDAYRIRFKGGVAKQMEWWLPNSTSIVNAESSRSEPQGGKMMRAGHSGYVMGMNGDFFMGQHKTETKPPVGTKGDDSNKAFYHSTYKAGQEVRCAGTWKVENGRVTEITDASGHYRPTLDHLIGAVETLRAYGVNISALKVFIFGAPEDQWESGADFLVNAARESLEQRRENFLVQEQESMLAKETSREGKIASAAKAVVDFDLAVRHIKTKSHVDQAGKPTTVASRCKHCSGLSSEVLSKASAAARAA